MAEEAHAVCVYGLPTDVDHERLRDKLLIHFLRGSNGGGEVTSVTIIGRTPVRALITFEDCRVVQSVLRHHPHILQLDGIKYELSLSLPSQALSLNKVILDMTVTIDCSQLPQVSETLNVLRSEFPGLRMECDLLPQTCTLKGNYSDFQGALPYIETLFNHQFPRPKYCNIIGDSGQHPNKREDLTNVKKWNSFASKSPGIHAGDLSSVSMVGFGQEHQRVQVNNEALIERSTQIKKSKREEGAECRIDEVDLEDLSIIMEADVFAYLQSIKEYKRILNHHGVQVVDVTSEGVTTLYLQSEVPNRSEVGTKQNIRQAHKELRQLYQQHEACLRKDQVKQSALCMLDKTELLKKVQLVLPNVLLSYDQDSVYIVGEKSEVSQAKQMLMLGVEEDMIRSLTEIPQSSSSSPSPESLEREQQVKRKSVLHTSVPPKLFGSSGERKGEDGSTKDYKLAARFKNSGLGLAREEMGGDIRTLTAKKDILKLASNSQSIPPTRSLHGTTGVLSNELTVEGTEAFRLTEPSCTGQDVLFKSQDPLSANAFDGITFSTANAKSTTSAGLSSAFETGVKASLNTSVNSLSASNANMKRVATSSTSVHSSKSSLRRSNSFSGRLRGQVQNNQITAEPIINTHTQRARSNSISDGRPRDECQITKVEAELTVSFPTWIYMKEVYSTQLDVIKSDLHMSEKQAGKNYTSVTLKGTDSVKVAESHRKLQNLVAVVASDFCVWELNLTDLGVREKDKLFETCCLKVKSLFCKVTLETTKNTIFLLGPKGLCSQASDIFKDVYSRQKSHSLSQMKTLQEGVDQGATRASLSIQPTKADHSKSDQNEKEFSFQDTSQVVQPNSSHKGLSTKQKSATLEKLESPRSMKTESNLLSQVANAKEEITGAKTDGPVSLPLEAHKKQDTSKTLKQTNLLSHTPSERCVCGTTGANVKRTTCGVVLCSSCKQLHAYCRVCGKEEGHSQKKVQSSDSKDMKQENQTGEQHSDQEDSKEHNSIQGTMTCVEMPLGLAGYNKFTTAKITYCIPDGIQGNKDPCPGSPFEGGLFEAYLPLNPKGKSLLPSLKKAFDQRLTFVIKSNKVSGGDAKVSWGKIPHKTRMEGGKSCSGYPDSTYLTLLSEALVAHGIEEASANSQDQAKS